MLGGGSGEACRSVDEAVREQGGDVRGFTGDGSMAMFGASVALEDAPLQGVVRRSASFNGSRQQGLASKHSPTISQRC